MRSTESGLIHILGHPTGRILNVREPIEIDLREVIGGEIRNLLPVDRLLRTLGRVH